MRDIRADLQERANFLQHQIKASQLQFEQLLEQLKREQQTKVSSLTSELQVVRRVLNMEHRRLGLAVSDIQAEQTSSAASAAA